MREFGPLVGLEVRAEITNLARSVFDRTGRRREVKASEFAMEDNPDRVVVDEADLRNGSERLRIAMTKPDARPPFEWLVEITSDVGEADYFKHYLIRDNDIVLAQRKVLTPIDETEARIVLADLRTAQDWLEA